MVLAILGFLVPQSPFAGRLILETPRVDNENQSVSITVLTEDAKVAGYYCDLFGRHGEKVGGKPFIWVEGTLSWLPLGTARYGHVWVEKGGALYGDASFPDEPRSPVRWDPDPKRGWRNARLTRLSKQFGVVSGFGKAGEVWTRNREELSRLDGDKLVRLPYSLAMVGIDGSGRHWGNRFEPGETPYNDILCYKDGKLLQTIELAELADVNAGGVGAGISIKLQLHAVYPAIFADGKTRLLPIPEAALGRVESINDKGEAVGYYWRDTLAEAPSVAYFWDGQKIVPLTAPEPGAAYFPAQINNRGDIAAVWRMDDRSRVYLTLGRDR